MFRDAVIQAATRPEVRDAVSRIYADLRAQIDLRRPLCSASGRCCRFEEFGHRMYVTTLELATFLHERPIEQSGQTGPWDGTGCPFQLGGLCSVHSIRPFGCRVFFCDATATQWQHDQYEQFHGKLRGLHDALSVPYFYVEWRHALTELGLADRADSGEARGDSAGPARDGKRTSLSLPQLPL